MTEADLRRRYTELADVYIQMFGAAEPSSFSTYAFAVSVTARIVRATNLGSSSIGT